MNIAWWVKRWSELRPHKTAIIFEDEKISYQALHQRVNRTCQWLVSRKIIKGDRVAVLLDNCLEFIELYLACSRLGAIFVPINYRLSAAELAYTLPDADPRIFIFGNAYAPVVMGMGIDIHEILMCRVGNSTHPLPSNVIDYHGEIKSCRTNAPFPVQSMVPTLPEEPHVIMYTSGTTGRPKGAVLSHRKTFFNCLNTDIFFSLTGDDIMLIVLPLFHSGGLFIQASPIFYKGATLILHRKFDPQKVCDDIPRYQVTKFLGVPTIYKSFLDMLLKKSEVFSSLKVGAIGGEQLTTGLMCRFSAAGLSLRQVMGQTETSILLWASEKDAVDKPGSVGRPVFHAEVRIVDNQGHACAPGQIGEIVVQGSIMMTQYWRDTRKTNQSIRDGWLHTGDLAYMDKDGYFFLVDRARDMYISGGENIYPAEIERVLRKHPSIDDVAVIGVADKRWNEVGVAFVKRSNKKELTGADVISSCKGQLARFKIPKHVFFIDHFPRTALGKIRKSILRQQCEENNQFKCGLHSNTMLTIIENRENVSHG